MTQALLNRLIECARVGDLANFNMYREALERLAATERV